ncbi:MAG: dTMP kinase [Acholeplasmatales bacterium]|nr:dTMP kinase [Acholeplasmatales bacterium]
MKMKGFITFEGGECSGKTTVINALCKVFEQKNIKYITTREPGGIRIAEDIRNLILDVKNTDMTPECEALLYAASRMQHLTQKVIPAIKDNKIVICDRFLDSSLAYQGYARGLGMDNVLKVNSFALDYLPELTIFIDVTPDVALKRMGNVDRDGKCDRLDQENQKFHEMVYKGYHEVLKMYPDRIVKVDGNKPLDEVVNECIDIVLKYIEG